MKKLILLICASALILTGCVASGGVDQGSWLDSSLENTDGQTVKLSSLKGKPTVIKVWSSWCSICLSGLKDYNELSGLDLDVNVISMVEPGRGAEKGEEEFVQWFNSLNEYEDLTVLLDTQQIVKDTFYVRAYPTFVYLYANGEVAVVAPGHQTNVQILETLASIEKE
ncbi:MAG: redoxin domain-containing protein [Clostridia bacterium]|jgi:thiol-disulfide isomerase/thioredoxin|nr:redoxin domain-containing protein [Clostridia bacterium]